MSVLPDRARRGSLPSREKHLAAVAALFAFDGAVFGSWAARIPDVTTQVGISHAGLGPRAAVRLGRCPGEHAADGRALRPPGTGRVAVAAAVLLCTAVVLPGLAHSLPTLAAARTTRSRAAAAPEPLLCHQRRAGCWSCSA